ncbi:hypothetical protein CP97_01790 [Aurantiacibacter atlanticus]|uniref:DUF2141 domain-containing protein n=1 Tax=Aurantiacibacter atlanticus TaxID=1648404 RepID=A0A0H4W0L8_9SPHN|nr:hypothetical protein CP97_01790 [Aurantiacibacter atlanticus]MDF1833539.1 DUF2141 domain-containing protein [Alteraurantiacibacter sp. bin_em_oilr2.035]
MQHRQGIGPARFAALITAFATAIIAAPTIAEPLGAEVTGTQVTITITNMRNTDGMLRACMTRDEDRFPRCQDATQGYRTVVPAGEATVLHFENVAPGTYAIALLHDENGNGRADRALGMMPREGFGFSRDAPVRMGPPDFEEAAISIGSSPFQQTIRMRYML